MKSWGKRITLFFALIIFFVLSNISCQKASQEAADIEPSRSNQLLKEIGDAYWQYILEESIYLRMKYGLKIHKLPDVSYQYAKSQSEFANSILEKLTEIDVEELGHEEALTYMILKWDAENSVEGLKFYWFYVPVTPYSSPLSIVNRVFKTYQFKEKEDLKHYLGLLKRYSSLISSIQNLLKEQYGKGIILPKEELGLVIPFLSAFIKQGSKSPFYVSDDRLTGAEDTARIEFQQDLIQIINSEFKPALENLVNYIKSDYLEKAPDRVGLWQYPGGRDYYEYLVRVNTTLELSPEEIHQIGLEQVKINDARVEDIWKSLGFKGTYDEFRQFLKTDPRFYPKTAEEIGDRFNSYIDAMSENIPVFF